MESRTLRLLEYPRVLDGLSRHASSASGQQACLSLHPHTDLDLISRICAQVRELLMLSKERAISLSPFPDLNDSFVLMSRPGQYLDLDGLWEIKFVLEETRRLIRQFSELNEDLYPLLSEASTACPWPEKLWSGLSRCLDQDGRLRDESSPELMDVRRELRAIHTQCTKKVTDYLSRQNLEEYLQDEYLTISSDRYVLALKSNFKGRLKGIIHDYSQSGETCYFEPFFLIELNNRLRSLKQDERHYEEEIRKYLTSLAETEQTVLKNVFQWLVDFDCALAKVKFAHELEGVIPEMGPEQPLRLMKARHPLLVLNKKEGVIPVDITLKEGQKVLIISGGNAGGKTVCLKTLGLMAVMAMSGLPVPLAEGSSLPFWEDIQVFIGDEQSLEDHVSTFTAQIHHLTHCWDKIKPSTLVIMDEFGAGTDPSQGAALSQAVIDELMVKDSWTVAVTHFPALKAYAMTTKGVRSASVLFDPKTKKPLYTLAYDQVGRSQALDVAREKGLDPAIINRAEKYLLVEGEDVSNLIDRLNALVVDREKELRALEQRREEYKEKIEKEQRRLAKERSEVLKEVKQHSQRIVKEWQAGKKDRKKALRELSGVRGKLAGAEGSGEAPKEGYTFTDIKEDMHFLYGPWNKTGKVIEKDEKKGQVKMDFGGVCIWAAPEDMYPPRDRDSDSTAQGHHVVSHSGGQINLDLRGKKVEEARTELNRFLDKAMLNGRKNLEVIHGKGTGVLRSEVHTLLRDFPSVRNFSLAPADQGGDGVTLVELR